MRNESSQWGYLHRPTFKICFPGFGGHINNFHGIFLYGYLHEWCCLNLSGIKITWMVNIYDSIIWRSKKDDTYVSNCFVMLNLAPKTTFWESLFENHLSLALSGIGLSLIPLIFPSCHDLLSLCDLLLLCKVCLTCRI